MIADSTMFYLYITLFFLLAFFVLTMKYLDDTRHNIGALVGGIFSFASWILFLILFLASYHNDYRSSSCSLYPFTMSGSTVTQELGVGKYSTTRVEDLYSAVPLER